MRNIDPENIHLTPEIVTIYRDLYYERYKPLLYQIKDDRLTPTEQNAFLKEQMSFYLDAYNWSWKYFQTIMSIDFMQRLVYDMKLYGHSVKMTSYKEYRHLDPNFGALRLKCSLRTEAPDPV